MNLLLEKAKLFCFFSAGATEIIQEHIERLEKERSHIGSSGTAKPAHRCPESDAVAQQFTASFPAWHRSVEAVDVLQMVPVEAMDVWPVPMIESLEVVV